jgi:hypothetical protein
MNTLAAYPLIAPAVSRAVDIIGLHKCNASSPTSS